MMEMCPRALANITSTASRCRLLELPAEVRDQIWIFAVENWNPAPTLMAAGRAETDDYVHIGPGQRTTTPTAPPPSMLQKMPIRMDRFNRPLPPAITRACTQTRYETLQFYYESNIFECWRPLFWIHDWSQSTFVDWLSGLGPRKTMWLNDIVLLYKHEGELENDLEEPLAELGFDLKPNVIRSRQELSEYEHSYEAWGLPRHFGRQRRWDRWLAGNASTG